MQKSETLQALLKETYFLSDVLGHESCVEHFDLDCVDEYAVVEERREGIERGIQLAALAAKKPEASLWSFAYNACEEDDGVAIFLATEEELTELFEENGPKYEIFRSYSPTHPERPNDTEVIKESLTLSEAKEHCKDPGTESKGLYFDGYRKE